MSRSLLHAAVRAVFFLPAFAPAFLQAGEPLVIVVTPSGIEQPEEEANTALTVIDQATIEQSNAGSVAELLRGQAGLTITDFFGDGSQATIDLRGFGPTAGSNTLVMIDGQKLNNSADSASPDLSLIDLDDIERIEILQGSSGVLYGNQAVGGVVNIIRRKKTEDSASVGIRAGSYNSSRFSASGVKVFGDNSLSASFSDWSSDNYRDHNESENRRLSLRAERNANGFNGFIEAEGVDDDIDTPGALLEDELAEDRRQSLDFYEDDFFETETRLLRVGLSQQLDESRTISADFTRRDTEREFIQTFRPFPGSLTTQDRDNTLFNASYRVVPAKPDVLASYLVGFSRDATDYKLVSAFGPQTIDQVIQDIYLSTHWAFGARNQVDAGLRYSDLRADIEDADFDDSVTAFSLGYSRSFEAMKLFARADQNFRYPTVEEHTNVPFGDPPGLETQQGVSLELGLEYRSAQNRVRGTLYRIDLDNEIGFDSSSANINLDSTRRHGLILEAGRQWSDAIDTRLSFTALDTEISDGEFEGNQLPLVPERSIRLDGIYRYSPETLLGLELVAVGEQVLGGDFANQLEKLDAYNVINAHASYDGGDWVLGLRINNLFNEKYSEIGNQFTSFPPPSFAPENQASFFPSPERNFWASLKINF
jgi:iron complex outermembrane receptor protein